MPFQQCCSRPEDATTRHCTGRGRSGSCQDGVALRLAVLAELARQPRSTAALIEVLASRGLGVEEAILPALRLLRGMGILDETTDPAGDTLHAIIDEGAAVLAAHASLLDALVAAVTPAGRRRHGGRCQRARHRHCCGHQPASPPPAAS